MILNILDQLEGEDNLCSGLQVLEFRRGEMIIADAEIDSIYNRIAAHNRRVGSHIELTERGGEWGHTSPVDDTTVSICCSALFANSWTPVWRSYAL